MVDFLEYLTQVRPFRSVHYLIQEHVIFTVSFAIVLEQMEYIHLQYVDRALPAPVVRFGRFDSEIVLRAENNEHFTSIRYQL